MIKRRSKQNAKYWKQRRENLYKAVPKSKLTENRYKALNAVLKEKYPTLCGHEAFYRFAKDIIHNSRAIRRETEGEQKLEKKILSQKFQLELDK